MRKLMIILVPVLLIIQISIGYCAEKYFTAGIGKLDGDNTYSIGGTYFTPGSGAGEDPFPISKLAFDIDVYMASFGAGIKFADKWEFSTEFKKNISSGRGVLQDSDYVDDNNAYTGDIPAIFSESNIDLDVWSANVNLQYRFIEGLYTGIGYLYQNFDYNIKDFRQWTTDAGVYGPGLGLTYDVKYHIPYLELGARGNISDEMRIETSVRYAPMVWAKDRDNHVVRGIYAQGDCEGSAWFLSLIARYDFPNRWFMVFEFDYSRITTEGDQKNYIDNYWQWTTDEEIESNQTYFTFTAGYRF